MHEKLGNAVVVVFDGCPFDSINEAETLGEAIISACRSAGADVRDFRAIQFYKAEAPKVKDGASAVAVLAESHAAGHSWPRQNRLVCVVYTCGSVDPLLIARRIGCIIGAVRFKVVQTDVDALILDGSVPWVSGGT